MKGEFLTVGERTARDKKMLADYLDGNARDLNAPPSMRKKKK